MQHRLNHDDSWGHKKSRTMRHRFHKSASDQVRRTPKTSFFHIAFIVAKNTIICDIQKITLEFDVSMTYSLQKLESESKDAMFARRKCIYNELGTHGFARLNEPVEKATGFRYPHAMSQGLVAPRLIPANESTRRGRNGKSSLNSCLAKTLCCG